MRRITTLLAAMAALLLVPAAQAFAAPPLENASTVEVSIAGNGAGEISSTFNDPNYGGEFKGVPPIACKYATPGPSTGNCIAEMNPFIFEEVAYWEAVLLQAEPAPGSEFVEWTVEGAEYELCNGGEIEGREACYPFVEPESGTTVEVTAEFEDEPGLPLTVVKEGTGSGTVVSNPGTIVCGSGKECWDNFTEGAEVTLTASPGTNSSFTSWKGCTTVEGRKCKVTMSSAKTVKAKFSPAYNVTVKKTTGNTGLGAISGVTCDANCTAATASYAVGKTVTLKPKASKGSEFTEWSSCPGEIVETSNCKMSAAGTAEAKFTATPQFKLTVKKSGGGQGTVKSSPSSINCGLTCSTQTSLFYKEASVVLTASVTAGKGSSLGNWSGGGCSGTEATPCTVSMTEAKEVTAEFK